MGSHPSTERCDPVACVTQLVACQVLNPTMLALDVCVNTLSCQCALTIVWGCVRSMVGQIMCNHCWVMMFSSALQPPALIVPRTHPPPPNKSSLPPPPSHTQGRLWDWYRQLYREGWKLDACSYSTCFR
jgi:hypothetical protein